MAQNAKSISKFMSLILRHHPDAAGNKRCASGACACGTQKSGAGDFSRSARDFE